MFSKDNAKKAGWVTLISGITSVITWLLLYLGGNNHPSPPLPKPDENAPISVATEFYCQPGDSIIIEPKYIGSIKWSIPTPYNDKLRLFPFPNNEKAVVNVTPSTSGPVYVAINGAYLDKDGKNLPTDVIYIRINTDKSPGPNPVPVPVPTPPPSFPDGKYKLSAFTYNSVISNVQPNYRNASQAFSRNYIGISSKIAAGAYNSSKNVQEDILKETTELNRKTLDDLRIPRTTWDQFFLSLQDNTYGMWQRRELTTKEDFGTAWQEIGIGFAAVK